MNKLQDEREFLTDVYKELKNMRDRYFYVNDVLFSLAQLISEVDESIELVEDDMRVIVEFESGE